MSRRWTQPTNTPPRNPGSYGATLLNRVVPLNDRREDETPGPVVTITSAWPSPSRSTAPTRTPVTDALANGWKFDTWLPVAPSNVRTEASGAPEPWPTTMSARPSPSRSPAPTNTPPVYVDAKP